MFYPRIIAPRTFADDLEWREITGEGVLYTFTVTRYPTSPAWKDEVPQLLGVIQLDEGPRLNTELMNVRPEELRVGMRMRPYFWDDPSRRITLLKYQPVAAIGLG